MFGWRECNLLKRILCRYLEWNLGNLDRCTRWDVQYCQVKFDLLLPYWELEPNRRYLILIALYTWKEIGFGGTLFSSLRILPSLIEKIRRAYGNFVNTSLSCIEGQDKDVWRSNYLTLGTSEATYLLRRNYYRVTRLQFSSARLFLIEVKWVETVII